MGVDESLRGFFSGMARIRTKHIFRSDVWFVLGILFRFRRDIWDKSFFDHVFRKDGILVLQAVLFGVPVQLLDGDIKFAMSITK